MLIIRKERNLGKPELTKFVWIAAMVAGGGCLAVNNKLNLYLSGVMDSAVFFPLVNGGGLVLTVVTALFVFKERLTVKQWIGVVVGIVAVIFLCPKYLLKIGNVVYKSTLLSIIFSNAYTEKVNLKSCNLGGVLSGRNIFSFFNML